jgi:hypothetical protein
VLTAPFSQAGGESLITAETSAKAKLRAGPFVVAATLSDGSRGEGALLEAPDACGDRLRLLTPAAPAVPADVTAVLRVALTATAPTAFSFRGGIGTPSVTSTPEATSWGRLARSRL